MEKIWIMNSLKTMENSCHAQEELKLLLRCISFLWNVEGKWDSFLSVKDVCGVSDMVQNLGSFKTP